MLRNPQGIDFPTDVEAEGLLSWANRMMNGNTMRSVYIIHSYDHKCTYLKVFAHDEDETKAVIFPIGPGLGKTIESVEELGEISRESEIASRSDIEWVNKYASEHGIDKDKYIDILTSYEKEDKTDENSSDV